jgi:BNR/Asp-box repeat
MTPRVRPVSLFATITALLVLTLAVVMAVRGGASIQRLPDGRAEHLEQQLTTQLRLDALRDARRAGDFGTDARVRRAPSAGWRGGSPLDLTMDDWEPAVAADPNAPFVYVLATRYGAKPCAGNCPSPHTTLSVSSDGGATWAAARPLCACKGSGQFDPLIEVVRNTGHVYAIYMNGFNVVFVKSTDHGQTWSAPVPTYGKVSWNDKPTMAASADGRHIYVSWNGPNAGDPWIAQSHDFGATWTQTKLVNSDRYFFAYDGTVLPNGTVVLSQSSIDYGGQGSTPIGQVWQHAFVSSNQGATWQNVVVDRVEIGEPCVAAGCSSDFYLGHSGVSADASGNLTIAYDGATAAGGKQSIFVRRSTDGGLTWSARSAVSTSGEHATAPALESTGAGDVRLWYYQTRNGDHDSWNTWYRRSADGGATWTAPALLSDATSGAGYKDANGFDEIYGDYGEIAVTNTGKTVAAWGEGFSWTGPGNVWVNVQS